MIILSLSFFFVLHIHQHNEENPIILHYMFLLSMVYYWLDHYILVNDVLIFHMHDLHHIVLLIWLMDPIIIREKNKENYCLVLLFLMASTYSVTNSFHFFFNMSIVIMMFVSTNTHDDQTRTFFSLILRRRKKQNNQKTKTFFVNHP
jgi:hypothetical protein